MLANPLLFVDAIIIANQQQLVIDTVNLCETLDRDATKKAH